MMKSVECNICNFNSTSPNSIDMGRCRGNTLKYHKQEFNIWKCPKCETIHCLDPVNMEELYSDYCLNLERPLDGYAKKTFSNLISRLIPYGFNSSKKVLDYGCGSGTFLNYLRTKGFTNIIGYDPYVKNFNTFPNEKFDFVILNDVLEHVEDPIDLIETAKSLLNDNGILYVGTADSSGVKNMANLESEIMRLHLPFHRKIINQKTLLSIGERLKLKTIASFQRSYMDTLIPFGNYRFLDEYNKALGHILEKALDPKSSSIVFKKPKLFIYAFLGYFMPSALEPAVIWKPEDLIA